MVPEDRNSTGVRRYRWGRTNETVDDAVFPLSERSTFQATVDETCLYFTDDDGNERNGTFVIKEEDCSEENHIQRVMCETVHGIPDY